MMKNQFSASFIKSSATMLGTILLAACGGGNTDNDPTHATVLDSTTQSADSAVMGTTNSSSAAVLNSNAANQLIGSETSSTPPDRETTEMANDLQIITTALAKVGTALATDSSPLDTVTVASASFEDSVPASDTVKILSTSRTSGQYVKYTEEGHSFTPAGTIFLRYGNAANNRWITKAVSGYGECDEQYFGADPSPGTPKVCQIWAATPDLIALVVEPILSKLIGNMPVIDLAQIPMPWVGFNNARVQPTLEAAPNSDIGAFRTSCGVAKLSFDDPIVYHGQVGKSHLHTFFGNTGVSANSTPESLRDTGGSTCVGGIANRSAYWVPTMIDTRTGTPVISTGNGVYYKTGYQLPTSVIHHIPAGLRMIAGNASATTPSSEGYRFKCVGGPNDENDQYDQQIGNCDSGATLIQEIFFPQCWDGVNLDSPDHKSHMAYPRNSACPADHPIAIPAISFNVAYTVPNKADMRYWRLSSDNYNTNLPAGYSSHGDWFNGWNSDISDAWGKNCVMAVKDCHSHLVGDGRMMY